MVKVRTFGCFSKSRASFAPGKARPGIVAGFFGSAVNGVEAVRREGLLPWRVAEFYGRLQRSFASLSRPAPSPYALDDIALFAIAATTLQLTGFGARYARASRLIGAVLLAAIGLMLLFRPQWLAFG